MRFAVTPPERSSCSRTYSRYSWLLGILQAMTSTHSEYEFAILGAGALGSILGAHLARAGHSVVMLARGRRADHIRVAGLHISGLAEMVTPVTVMTDPAQLRSAGTLIVAMKTPGTDAALERLRHV